MSAFDALFNKSFFRAAKCKTLLKLTIPRIKLLRNRREMQLKQMRKEIAKLLETGQEATARIRVEHIMREENMMAVQEILELFCELVTVRLPIIESQRECPLDLKEAISSICFAALRCADLPELQQVQMMFAAKYGREFVAAATELLPGCSVNRQIIELLSVRAPVVEKKIKLLKEIAEEHDVDWNPAASESELLKQHDDLLNGPSAFISESALPLPKEKYSESLQSSLEQPIQEFQEHEPDTGFELDLPEVPKISVLTTSAVNKGNDLSTAMSANEVIPPFPNVPPSNSVLTSTSDGVSPHNFSLHMSPHLEDDVKESPEQFVPFVSSIPSSVTPHITGPHEVIPSFSIPSASPTPSPVLSDPQAKTEIAYDEDLRHTLTAAHEAVKTAEHSIPSFSVQPQIPFTFPSPSHVKAETGTNDDDLEDVIAAAHAAAETAERAAAAARAVASLAQVRITELTMKKNGKLPEKFVIDDPKIDSSQGFAERDGTDGDRSPEKHSLSVRMHELQDTEPESPYTSYQPNHQPSRSSSLEDDPYFSYPNLFSRQNSELKAATDKSP